MELTNLSIEELQWLPLNVYQEYYIRLAENDLSEDFLINCRHYADRKDKILASSHSMLGKVVSEEEVAKELGFANVNELKRWETKIGIELFEAQAKLREVEGDRDRFLWHGKRMQSVLERTKIAFEELQGGCQLSNESLSKLILAIGVVCGKEVDWDHTLEDWGL